MSATIFEKTSTTDDLLGRLRQALVEDDSATVAQIAEQHDIFELCKDAIVKDPGNAGFWAGTAVLFELLRNHQLVEMTCGIDSGELLQVMADNAAGALAGDDVDFAYSLLCAVLWGIEAAARETLTVASIDGVLLVRDCFLLLAGDEDTLAAATFRAGTAISGDHHAEN